MGHGSGAAVQRQGEVNGDETELLLIGGLMVVAVLVATLVLYPHLPERVPSHWDIHDEVDDYSARWTLLIFMPATMAGTMLLFAALQWLSPHHFEVDTFRSTYPYIMVVLLGLFAYIQEVWLWAAVGGQFKMGRVLMGGIGLLIALLGNVMGKVHRNFYIGIRTPWTLADERVWYATHRFGAKTFVVGGLLAFVSALAGAGFWFPVAAIMAAALIPAVYSLVCSKRLERRGEV